MLCWIKLNCLFQTCKCYQFNATVIFTCFTEGKYLVLPSGELHIRDVGPEDGYKSYQCRTKHRLTGETRLSATKGRLVITGELKKCLINKVSSIHVLVFILHIRMVSHHELMARLFTIFTVNSASFHIEN